MKLFMPILLVLLFQGPLAEAAPVTTATEQRALVEALSGAAHLGVGGLPDVISQRFSDSPEIFTTARYLVSRYREAGIEAEIAEYSPRDAFPYYYQNTDKTYRTYFKHLAPQLTAEFNALCDGTLPPEKIETVLKRLVRVGLDKPRLCAQVAGNRLETYMKAAIDHTAAVTRKMIDERQLSTWPNVIAYVRTGTSDGEAGQRPLCVVGAHMDSVARDGGGRGPIVSPGTLAPGADDNASGTAAVLTLARAMRGWLAGLQEDPGFRCDLAFVHFSGEEEGLLGSLAFTRLQNTRPVLWMVNFDMIAYNGSPEGELPVMNIGYDSAYGRAMAEHFSSTDPSLRSIIVERETFIYSSDQIAFWDMNVPAISISEQACSSERCDQPFKRFNPYLHTPQDVVGVLDFSYAASIINQSAGGLRRLLNGTRY